MTAGNSFASMTRMVADLRLNLSRRSGGGKLVRKVAVQVNSVRIFSTASLSTCQVFTSERRGQVRQTDRQRDGEMERQKDRKIER